MDASVALMNQYTMIANQFPLPANTTPTTSVGTSTSTTPTTENTNATASETTVESTPKSNAEEKEISDSIDSGAGPSTSKATNSTELTELESKVTIEDIGRNDPSEPDESISEVRRRRLQRFEAKGTDS